MTAATSMPELIAPRLWCCDVCWAAAGEDVDGVEGAGDKLWLCARHAWVNTLPMARREQLVRVLLVLRWLTGPSVGWDFR